MRHVTGIEKDRVQAWPAGGEGLRQRFLRRNIACVGWDHPGLIAQNALCLGEGVRVASGHGDACPFGDKRLRGGETDTAGAAGNQRILIG